MKSNKQKEAHEDEVMRELWSVKEYYSLSSHDFTSLVGKIRARFEKLQRESRAKKTRYQAVAGDHR